MRTANACLAAVLLVAPTAAAAQSDPSSAQADAFDGPTQWRAHTGAWQQTDGVLSQAAEDEAFLTFAHAPVRNASIRIRIRFPDRAPERYAGVAFGLDGEGTGFCVYLANHPTDQHNNLVKLRTIERGHVTERSFREVRSPIETGRWYAVRIETAESRVLVYLDGERLIAHTVPCGTAGIVGLWSMRAKVDFDDLRIQPTELMPRGPGREKRFARVNPVFPSQVRRRLSLDGEWQFRMDREDAGEAEGWTTSQAQFPDRIRLPGCWEAQGFGGTGQRTGYGGTPVRLRGSYRGAAWFRKTVAIPASWQGHRIWLKFGGVHPCAQVWCNGVYLGTHSRYFEPFKFDVTELVKAGQATTVVARVDNRERPLGGCFNAVWPWGGIHRSVILEATGMTSIQSATVLPDLDRSCVSVAGTLEDDPPRTGELRIEAVAQLIGTSEVSSFGRTSANVRGRAFSLDLPIPDIHPWSTEAPRLYRLDLRLALDGELTDTWSERFGFCKREVRGNDVFINNRKVFVRAYGNDCVYPVTIAPPASREAYLWRFRRAREFGFTYARHHTWIPLPEYFDAADEVGVMLQPELPHGGPVERLDAVIRNYRNHPSLATYSMTNESYHGGESLSELYRYAKTHDPARFAIDSDGSNGPVRSTSDLWITFPIPKAKAPCFEIKPVIHHEFLNLPTIPDPSALPTFVGGFQPTATETLSAWAGVKALEGEVRSAVHASRYMQKLYQKEGIERARRERELDGYCYWTIADFWEFSQGLLDMLWQPKGWSAAEFQRFNGAAALLAELPAHTAWQGESIDVKLFVSNYSGRDIRDAQLRWRLSTGQQAVAEGVRAGLAAEAGDVTGLGAVDVVLPELDCHAQQTLRCELKWDQGSLDNQWDIWTFSKAALAHGLPSRVRFRGRAAELAAVFPGSVSRSGPEVLVADMVEASDLDFFRRGGRMLLTSASSLPHQDVRLHPGWWSPRPGNQVGLAIGDHPALTGFPHEGAAGFQLRSLLRSVVACDRLPFAVTPIIYGLSHPLHRECELRSCLFEFPVGAGMMLVSGLDLQSAGPESRSLLDCLLTYATGPDFKREHGAGAVALEAFTPSLDKLSITKTVEPAKARPATAVAVEIRVANEGLLACDVDVSDVLPDGIETLDTLRWTSSLRAREQRTFSYMIRAEHAGGYVLPPAWLEAYGRRKQANPAQLTIAADVAQPQVTRIPATAPDAVVATWPFDEAKGSVARDRSGKHIMALEEVTWSYGVASAALRFNGRTSRASVPDSNALDLPGPLTVMLWFRPSRLHGDHQCLVDKGGSGCRNYGIYLVGSDIVFIVYAQGDEYQFPTRGLGLTPREWHHVACSYDGERIRILVDGRQKVNQKTTFGSLEPTDSSLFLGCRGPQNDMGFEGLLDQVTISRTAARP